MMQFNKALLIVLSLFLCASYARADSSVVEVTGERFILDLKYNTAKNFLGTNVYEKFGLKRCLVHPDMAAALRKIELKLKEKNLKLVLFDCFRPIEVQREMWKIVSDPKFVADPKKGSNHNRGVAVDVGLASDDGTPLIFPTQFDDFTSRAFHSFECPSEERAGCSNRATLKELMIFGGLKPISSEWWHYELPEAKKYPLIERTYAQPQ